MSGHHPPLHSLLIRGIPPTLNLMSPGLCNKTPGSGWRTLIEQCKTARNLGYIIDEGAPGFSPRVAARGSSRIVRGVGIVYKFDTGASAIISSMCRLTGTRDGIYRIVMTLTPSLFYLDQLPHTFNSIEEFNDPALVRPLVTKSISRIRPGSGIWGHEGMLLAQKDSDCH
ncbi:uncharacterized protein MCYG_06036 [Microsporum canis CBS 113480]|uniref:Uncharacterized protein n=1 Tax=Arthroderma otae (strain ATCC MYA-4605 / CBS 113480) TaxID=554155 RepID=C5FTL4_ARTOC|nr:uncharacterized protein MCYG_06036 [Microsporum canis CBS 113480]EEQ33217.1 predicted protein [Microsporum canis CBS 113480]